MFFTLLLPKRKLLLFKLIFIFVLLDWLCFVLFVANDVLLSHMITFLNDKEDKELRGTFFDCIVGVAAYIGWHCSTILTPLLQQVPFLLKVIEKQPISFCFCRV